MQRKTLTTRMHDALVSNTRCIVRWPGCGIPMRMASSVVEGTAMRRCAAPANLANELDPVSTHESFTVATTSIVDPASGPKSKSREATGLFLCVANQSGELPPLALGPVVT